MSIQITPAQLSHGQLTSADRTLLRAVLAGRSLPAVAAETGLSEGVARDRLAAILRRVREVADRDERRQLAAAFVGSRSEPAARRPTSPQIPAVAGVAGAATAAAQGGRLTAADVGRIVRQRLAAAGLSEHRVGRVHLRDRSRAEAGVLSSSGRMVLLVEVDRRSGAIVYYD